MSALCKFYFRPGESERVETTVTLQPDIRSAIHGLVRDAAGLPVKDALAMLFEIPSDGVYTLTGQIFTDEDGRFVFGPLNAGQMHMVKVYKNTVKLRPLEIITEEADCFPG